MEDLASDVSLRPYFIPDELDFDELPAAVQVAVEALVAPAYQELVLQAPSALERAAGASFVHLLFLELLEQFELGQQISENVKSAGNRTSPREADLRRHLRLLSAKERAGTFLLRIRQFQATKGDPMVCAEWEPTFVTRTTSPQKKKTSRSRRVACSKKTPSWRMCTTTSTKSHLNSRLEMARTPDQRRTDVLRFIAEQTNLLRHTGCIISTWREYGGRRLGPYYQLSFFEQGKSRMVYLGKDLQLVADVRQELKRLQTPLQRRRKFQRQRLALQRSLIRHRAVWNAELNKLGLYLKGSEIRGWQSSNHSPG